MLVVLFGIQVAPADLLNSRQVHATRTTEGDKGDSEYGASYPIKAVLSLETAENGLRFSLSTQPLIR